MASDDSAALQCDMRENTICVTMLGEFAFSNAADEWMRWRSNKARSLFGVLLVNKNIVVGKDRLRELLWPGADRSSTSLKVAMHTLRKVLDTHLGADRDHLRVEYRDFGYIMDVGDEVIIDCHEFERYAAAARDAAARGRRAEAVQLYRRAAALYSGDFFSGERDGWVTEQRHWLRSTALSTWAALAEYALEAGELGDAADACRRTLAIDSANEAAFRRMMVIHARRGELQQAEWWYELCAKRLREQFELDPDHHTRALLRRVLNREFVVEPRLGRTGRIVHKGVRSRIGSTV
ncbi:BTAD domain-containing putative transcriptional regulator [Nocardia sp. NPDC006630]|uniref:AfsR/SARP family transcriptional regulator n=1 Tax=Nocardia sp. NPDC006630 TaxID=3157181 RepID=UPI0033A6BAE4